MVYCRDGNKFDVSLGGDERIQLSVVYPIDHIRPIHLSKGCFYTW